MTRRLSQEESALWERLRETVRPLRRRKREKPPESDTPNPPRKSAALQKKTARPATVAASPKPRAPSAPALAPFEEKILRRLGRGLVEIDDRIDLHGMRQERAFSALAAFLRQAQTRGDRIVLVVTGKGRGSEARIGESARGVLQEAVPSWLSRAELRPFVVGFKEAGRRHGGGGALYVRIRRRRAADARPPPP